MSLLGLHSVDGLPGVVLSSVDGLAMELGVLVVVFAGSIDGGAGMVGSVDVGVDDGAVDVPGGDGGRSHGQGGGVDYRGVGNGQPVPEAVGGCEAMCQQARGHGGGASEDGGGYDLEK